MAATVELFEHGRTIHEDRPLRSDQVQLYEAVARAKYIQQVESKRIALESWGQYLAYVDSPRRLVSRTHQPESGIVRARQGEGIGSKQRQQPAVEANADIPGGLLRDALDVESGNEASAEEETDLDEVGVQSRKGKASVVVDLRDRGRGTDRNVQITSGSARRRGRVKGVRTRKGLGSGCNAPSLTPQPAGNSTDEDDVAASKKSGSFALFEQQLPANTANNPGSALYSAYVHASQSPSHDIGITSTTASIPGEAGEMDDLSGQVSKIALEGDEERADEGRSRWNDSAGKLFTTKIPDFWF
jgi:hypothetical protein